MKLWRSVISPVKNARQVGSTRILQHQSVNFENAPSITVHWKDKHGKVTSTPAKVGMNLLQVAHREGIDLEGACEGVCACSTCHVILEAAVFDNLPEPSEEEEDMLDLAFGLTATSRLGCQTVLEESHNGMVIVLPSATRNFYVDGHVPKPH